MDAGRPAGAQSIQGPPEFIRAVELQQAYWTYSLEEQRQLEEQGLEALSWAERLRLHHLTCLQWLNPEPGQEASAAEKCRATSRLLVTTGSPYRPRPVMIWQGQPETPQGGREPDLQGGLLNPSLTHLGCLEIYRVDAANQPTEIDFIGFDELSGLMFARPTLIRAAKLFYNDGSDEIVLVPMLYGLSWTIGTELDRGGSMTRFVAHLDDDEMRRSGVSGLGVGQQDFLIQGEGDQRLLGMGSVSNMVFPLDMDDPRFDEKARARGIDPAEVRRSVD